MKKLIMFLTFNFLTLFCFSEIILDTPIVETTNSIRIDTVVIMTTPGMEQIAVGISIGYDDGSGNFVKKGGQNISLVGDEFDAIANKLPDGTKTYWENLKSDIYNLVKLKLGISGIVK